MKILKLKNTVIDIENIAHGFNGIIEAVKGKVSEMEDINRKYHREITFLNWDIETVIIEKINTLGYIKTFFP